jgi:hypothetical protein
MITITFIDDPMSLAAQEAGHATTPPTPDHAGDITISFVARDRKQLDIPWVQVKHPDGRVVEYFTEPLSKSRAEKAEREAEERLQALEQMSAERDRQRARAEKAEREANEWRARAEAVAELVQLRRCPSATREVVRAAHRYSPRVVLDGGCAYATCEVDPIGAWLRRSDLLPADE